MVNIELTSSERDWLLKRVLDAIAEVNDHPVNKDIDDDIMKFFESMRDKLRNAESEGAP